MGICLCPNSYNIVRRKFIKLLQIYSQKLSEAVVPIENNSVLSTSQKEADDNINSNIQFIDNKNNSQQIIEPLSFFLYIFLLVNIISKPKNPNNNMQVNSLFINYRFVNKFRGNLETVFEVRSEMSNSKFESKEQSRNGNSKFSKKVDN